MASKVRLPIKHGDFQYGKLLVINRVCSQRHCFYSGDFPLRLTKKGLRAASRIRPLTLGALLFCSYHREEWHLTDLTSRNMMISASFFWGYNGISPAMGY